MKKTTLMFVLVWALALTGTAQTVTTFTEGTPDDAIALDQEGNIYASNFTGDTVFKYTTTGTMTEFITGLDTPNGIAFDANGNFFVCDWNANTIYKYDALGVLLNSYAATGKPSGMIKSFTGTQMIYTEYQGNKINRLEDDGTITLLSDDPELNGPVGLAFDENGNLFVGNYNDRKIFKVLPSGDLEYIAQLPASGANPNLGFITYGLGRLWGTIMGDHKIYTINPNEIDSYLVYAGSTLGSEDGPLATATFNRPNGILANETGDILYITDFGSKNLRIVSDVVLDTPDNTLNLDIAVYKEGSDSLAIKLPQPENNVALRVYNLLGQAIYTNTTNFSQGKVTLNTASWETGVYVVNVQLENGTVLTKKWRK